MHPSLTFAYFNERRRKPIEIQGNITVQLGVANTRYKLVLLKTDRVLGIFNSTELRLINC